MQNPHGAILFLYTESSLSSISESSRISLLNLSVVNAFETTTQSIFA